MIRLRVVLDANVLAPGLVSRRSSSAEIVRLWRLGLFEVLVTGKLIGETAETLKALGLQDYEVVELVEIIASNPDAIVFLKHQVFGCVDPADDYLFETAIVGQASIIVSRDMDLQALPKPLQHQLNLHHVRVMTDLEFLAYLRRHIFSPLAFDPRFVSFDDLQGPLKEVSCVVCRHGFHWDFPCGQTYADESGAPWLCECPLKAGLQPA
ncbi:MAG TPA: putative toxin-antitoxin system toxin component, PIN family [Candidatus Baltobacteraceae bacterium]|nr:putative toxin-antitoxin system toxin component, PIN family [Candidatus Baltobacteraceae bacterium]